MIPADAIERAKRAVLLEMETGRINGPPGPTHKPSSPA